ncbi:hypothetical protein [uncultured Acetobacterium sp.]|uniref:hypothetical protein n=1 Tax=uncultured Acetobacterium sp. TaxID=217139 RepID=UPI0025DB5F6C|nr:hypothetical protein [uncultured Acetobacterium sp.]
MINRAEEMLAYYFWICLEGIVALWYLKSDHEFVNKIIDAMTKWAFSPNCGEEVMKVIDAERNTDIETRMIADFFIYLIDNEQDGPTPVDVLSRYLIESEIREVQKIYESMKDRIEQSKQAYYLDHDREKERAVQRQIIGEGRFKEAEKEVPMLMLLGALIKRNFRVSE